MDVCPRLCVSRYPVWAEALCWTDVPLKETFQMSKHIHDLRSISELEQGIRPNLQKLMMKKKNECV
jgi:hypothetical protein